MREREIKGVRERERKGEASSLLRYPWESFCRLVMGQSLWVRRSCLSCVTSLFSMVTSFCRGKVTLVRHHSMMNRPVCTHGKSL